MRTFRDSSGLWDSVSSFGSESSMKKEGLLMNGLVNRWNVITAKMTTAGALAAALTLTIGAQASAQVTSADIVDGQVKTPDIASAAVTTPKIANSAVTSASERRGD